MKTEMISTLNNDMSNHNSTVVKFEEELKHIKNENMVSLFINVFLARLLF